MIQLFVQFKLNIKGTNSQKRRSGQIEFYAGRIITVNHFYLCQGVDEYDLLEGAESYDDNHRLKEEGWN